MGGLLLFLLYFGKLSWTDRASFVDIEKTNQANPMKPSWSYIEVRNSTSWINQCKKNPPKIYI